MTTVLYYRKAKKGGDRMTYETSEKLLKNGKTAIFRSPTEADAHEMVEYLCKTAGETDFLIGYPEERKLTDEQEAIFLRKINESSKDMMIVCEVDGRIAGNCSIMFNSRIKTRHRASVGIALLKDFWGLGIGTLMFEDMILLAKQRGVMQIELEVVEGNERAMALYRKMGFEIVAEKPNAIRLKDGTLLKEFIMIKML